MSPPQAMEAESPPRALELSALEAEKEPMAAAEDGGGPPADAPEGPPPEGPDPELAPPAPALGEKNGLVVKLEEAELEGGGAGGAGKFTGLGKEELLRAAAAPPWRRARCLLLLLFWGGWLGMVGAAAAIVARAPRCRPLPAQAWWQLGALYRAPPEALGERFKGEGGGPWERPLPVSDQPPLTDPPVGELLPHKGPPPQTPPLGVYFVPPSERRPSNDPPPPSDPAPSRLHP